MSGGITGVAAGGQSQGPKPSRPVRQSTGLGQRNDEDVRTALVDAEQLVSQTTTRLAAEEARSIALDQQVQAMQGQGPSILAELWLNYVEMVRTMNTWTGEQTKEAYFLSMEGATTTCKQATLQDEGPEVLATLAQFKEAFLKGFKKLKTPVESVQLVAQLKQTSAGRAWITTTGIQIASTRLTRSTSPTLPTNRRQERATSGQSNKMCSSTSWQGSTAISKHGSLPSSKAWT